jgi:hypothetical protein
MILDILSAVVFLVLLRLVWVNGYKNGRRDAKSHSVAPPNYSPVYWPLEGTGDLPTRSSSEAVPAGRPIQLGGTQLLKAGGSDE